MSQGAKSIQDPGTGGRGEEEEYFICAILAPEDKKSFGKIYDTYDI